MQIHWLSASSADFDFHQVLSIDVRNKEKNLLDPFAFRVEQIQQLVSVDTFRCSEQNHLESGRDLLEKLPEKRPRAHVDCVVAFLVTEKRRVLITRVNIHAQTFHATSATKVSDFPNFLKAIKSRC